MKVFFASQFLIASLLMVWNATKKGVWDNLPFRKTSTSVVVCASPSIPTETEKVFLKESELPHFDHPQLVSGQIPLATTDQKEPVSPFPAKGLNREWELSSNSKRMGNRALDSSDLFPGSPVLKAPEKNPLIAAGLSIIPGLGHTYLEDTQTARALIGSASVAHGLYLSMQYSDSFYDLFNSEGNASAFLSSMRLAQTTELYGIFAAYRDARVRTGSSGYMYKMPSDSLMGLTRAPFDPSVLRKPQVWGGILGALAIAKGVMWLSGPLAPAQASINPTNSLLSLPVSLGEETFFRGFLQSELSEHLTPWGGIAASSALFAAAHIPNSFAIDPSMRWKYYTLNLPLLAGLGAYFGYLTKESGSLKDSVAVHTWYDFALMASDALFYSASTGNVGFATSFSF